MSEFKGLCTNCQREEVEITLYEGVHPKKLCQVCANVLLVHYANKGLESLLDLLYRNFEEKSVENIANQLFDSSEVAAEMAKYKELVPMFTYGILKIPNNIEYDGGVGIVENAKVIGHVMYATNGRSFPVTKVTGKETDVIYGTYFEIPRKVVECSYDITEGYEPTHPEDYNMYNRKAVEVILPSGEKKQANMYIANPQFFVNSMVDDYQIMTGNYDDKLTHMRMVLERGEA